MLGSKRMGSPALPYPCPLPHHSLLPPPPPPPPPSRTFCTGVADEASSWALRASYHSRVTGGSPAILRFRLYLLHSFRGGGHGALGMEGGRWRRGEAPDTARPTARAALPPPALDIAPAQRHPNCTCESQSGSAPSGRPYCRSRSPQWSSTAHLAPAPGPAGPPPAPGPAAGPPAPGPAPPPWLLLRWVGCGARCAGDAVLCPVGCQGGGV